MTKKELRRLSRADLLEMLIDQSIELEALRTRCEAAETALNNRELCLNNAGSIAEAALGLSGVFTAAEAAAQQYLEELQNLVRRQQEQTEPLLEQARQDADKLLEEARHRCEEMEREAKISCAEMTARAKAEAAR